MLASSNSTDLQNCKVKAIIYGHIQFESCNLFSNSQGKKPLLGLKQFENHN